MLEISCDWSSKQTIHMKSQALFSLKKKIENIVYNIWNGALWVNFLLDLYSVL